MDNRSWLSGAAGSAPAAPSSPSAGYPTSGNPGVTPPTIPGDYWYHQTGEEIRAVIAAGGLTPSRTVLTQLRDAIAVLIGGVGAPIACQIALSFGGGSTGITYSSRQAWAFITGKRVEIFGQFALTSKGSSTGTAQFSISFVAGGTFPLPTAQFPAMVSVDIMAASLPGPLKALMLTSGLHEFRYFDAAAGTDANVLTNAHFTNTSVVYVAGTYVAP